MNAIQGLHHITAVAGDPQANLVFYQRVLGQRLVKTTVNFDDPGTYHLYYGDETGTPGTILTFFPWRHMPRGRVGAGETSAVAYAIPRDALSYWLERLTAFGLSVKEVEPRFGDRVIRFYDPDGMKLELVASGDPSTIQHWNEGPVDAAHALRGFHSVSLLLHEVEPTAELLTGQLGYRFVGTEGDRHRYAGASSDRGLYVDLVHAPNEAPGRFGAGSIHHIAFRTVDDEEQIAYQTRLYDAGVGVTEVKDRQYFHSIYFRSPGGVLFEIATDAPGFAYDEPVPALGSALKLPPWMEPRRAEIETRLPAIDRAARHPKEAIDA
ncbi:MAG: ring-cleaving dioxygenase [Rhodothermales bacterium]